MSAGEFNRDCYIDADCPYSQGQVCVYFPGDAFGHVEVESIVLSKINFVSFFSSCKNMWNFNNTCSSDLECEYGYKCISWKDQSGRKYCHLDLSPKPSSPCQPPCQKTYRNYQGGQEDECSANSHRWDYVDPEQPCYADFHCRWARFTGPSPCAPGQWEHGKCVFLNPGPG